MIEAVIFDIDGTLLDSNDVHAHAWHEAFLEFGKLVEDKYIRNSIGKGGDNLLPDFWSPAEIERIGEPLKKRRGEIMRSRYLKKLKPFTFVRELGQKLKQAGCRLAVATSAEEAELKVMLELCDFGDLIETAATSADAKNSKPNPDIFLAALDRLGNPDSSRVMVVGDSPYDVEGALKAGLRTVAVLSGGFSRESLEEAGAHAIVQSVSELYVQFEDSPFVKA